MKRLLFVVALLFAFPAFGQDEKKKEDELPKEPLPLARALIGRGRHDEAETMLRALVEKDAKTAGPRAALAELYAKQGRADEAAREAAKAIELDPSDARALVISARLLEEAGKLDDAEAALHKAIALENPAGSAFEARVRLARLRYERGGKREAGKLLSRALEGYQAKSELTAEEYVWVARACRLYDYFPEGKPAPRGEWAKAMPLYASERLNDALDQDPKCVEALIEYGDLQLDKDDPPEATKSLAKAVEIDRNDPDARTAYARALLAAFYKGSARYGEAESQLLKALAVDPAHADALALLATLALQDGDFERARVRAEAGLAKHPAHVGLHVALATAAALQNDKKAFAEVEKKLVAARPSCARFYDEVARILALKFRYAEARDLAKKALEIDPEYFPAKTTLGVNLLRTADEEKGWSILGDAFKDDPYDVIAFNSLELSKRVRRDYETVETDHFVVRLHKKEKAAMTPYALALLEEARDRLGHKYGVTPGRVLVEIFPKLEDFSARSIGLPFIPALGVCFDNVVTVLSSKEKGLGKHSWGRTLWHEFGHVCTLARSKNRVPRWFTEGLSVYEESRGRRTWTREYDTAILELRARGLLMPVARFDEAFSKPKYGSQVMMGYYQGGLACEFMEKRWGVDGILRLLDQYAAGKATVEAIPGAFGVPCDEFDREFLAFVDARYARVAWVPAAWPELKDKLLDRVQTAPWDISARGALARAYAMLGSPADAEVHAQAAIEAAAKARRPFAVIEGIDLLEGEPASGLLSFERSLSVRAGAADAHLALGLIAMKRERPDRAERELQRALALGTRDPVNALNGLAGIARATGRISRAAELLQRIEGLVPPSADLHRSLAALYAAMKDEDRARDELDRACSLDSDDLDGRVELARRYAKLDRWRDVVRVLDDAALIDPYPAEPHWLLAEGLKKVGRFERAIVEYDQAIVSKHPAPADADAGAAVCFEKIGKKVDALARAQKALQEDPSIEDAKAIVERLGKDPAAQPPKEEPKAPEKPAEPKPDKPAEPKKK